MIGIRRDQGIAFAASSTSSTWLAFYCSNRKPKLQCSLQSGVAKLIAGAVFVALASQIAAVRDIHDGNADVESKR